MDGDGIDDNDEEPLDVHAPYAEESDDDGDDDADIGSGRGSGKKPRRGAAKKAVKDQSRIFEKEIVSVLRTITNKIGELEEAQRETSERRDSDERHRPTDLSPKHDADRPRSSSKKPRHRSPSEYDEPETRRRSRSPDDSSDSDVSDVSSIAGSRSATGPKDPQERMRSKETIRLEQYLHAANSRPYVHYSLKKEAVFAQTVLNSQAVWRIVLTDTFNNLRRMAHECRDEKTRKETLRIIAGL